MDINHEDTDKYCKELAGLLVPDIIENYPDGDLIYASDKQREVEILLKQLVFGIKQELIHDVNSTLFRG